jgi:hypothetical protein
MLICGREAHDRCRHRDVQAFAPTTMRDGHPRISPEGLLETSSLVTHREAHLAGQVGIIESNRSTVLVRRRSNYRISRLTNVTQRGVFDDGDVEHRTCGCTNHLRIRRIDTSSAQQHAGRPECFGRPQDGPEIPWIAHCFTPHHPVVCRGSPWSKRASHDCERRLGRLCVSDSFQNSALQSEHLCIGAGERDAPVTREDLVDVPARTDCLGNQRRAFDDEETFL